MTKQSTQAQSTDSKLSLNRNTLRTLTATELQRVAGGPGSGGGATSRPFAR